MPRLLRTSCLAWLFLIAGTPGGYSQTVDAENRLIERLLEEDLAEFAVDYLSKAGSDPLIPDEIKRVAPYRIAAIRVDQAIAQRSPDRRAAALEAARELVESLSKPSEVGGPEGRALTDAIGRLGLAEADEARRIALAAASGEAKNALRQARGALADAKQRLESATDRYEAEIDTLRSAVATTPDGERRRDLKLRLAQARLLSARLDNELAATYAPDSDKAEELNRAAAKRLGELYEKYSKWVVGLYAHLYEGRCHRQLGETALAAGCFESLVTQPATTPELSRLVTLANAELAALRIDKGEIDLAIEDGEAWLDELDVSQQRGAEAATLRYWLGVAYRQRSESGNANELTRKRSLRSARQLLGEAARTPSEIQALARDAWMEATTALGVDVSKPESFEEAFQAGKDAIEAFSAAEVGLAAAPPDNAEVRAELETQRDESRQTAERTLEAALELADRRSPEEQVNEARYLLAYLYYNGGDDEKSTNLAARVALRSPDDPSAEAAARLALASLDRRRRQPLEQDEADRVNANLRKLAEFTVERWPEGDAAPIARQVLLAQALDAGDLAAADAVVAGAPAPSRPSLALRVAAAKWERLRSNPETTEQERTRTRAELASTLEAAAKAGTAAPLRATAALYLAEALLDAGDPVAALSLIDAPEHGVAAALEERSPPADNEAFALAAARVCLRGYAFASDNPERATAAIDQLVAIAESGGSPASSRDALLASAVKQQADLAGSRVGEEAREHAARTLGETLARLNEPLADADWNAALWHSQALLKLADTTPGGRGIEFARRASDAFERLAKRITSEPGFAPSESAGLAVKLQLAECERRLGDYSGAFEAFASLLEERAALLEVQRSAARALQDWGVAQRDPNRLDSAIAGARPGSDGKNAVWGWAKLAAVAGQSAATDPKRRELFFEAWLNVARCRYAAAKLRTGAEQVSQLRKAASTVRAMQRQYPDLGGPQRKREFDDLGAKINATLKEVSA